MCPALPNIALLVLLPPRSAMVLHHIASHKPTDRAPRSHLLVSSRCSAATRAERKCRIAAAMQMAGRGGAGARRHLWRRRTAVQSIYLPAYRSALAAHCFPHDS